MDQNNTEKAPTIASDPNFGGMSAGAQNGGIVDAGEADNETDYSDALAGRKGGMVINDTWNGYVDTGDFDSDDAESAGAGIGGSEAEA
jgi:hypothetical protein